MKNSCRIYFQISGDFDTNEVINKLEMLPNEIINKGDKVRDYEYNYSVLTFGENSNYNVDINIMILETIKDLKNKIKNLIEFKKNK